MTIKAPYQQDIQTINDANANVVAMHAAAKQGLLNKTGLKSVNPNTNLSGTSNTLSPKQTANPNTYYKVGTNMYDGKTNSLLGPSDYKKNYYGAKLVNAPTPPKPDAGLNGDLNPNNLGGNGVSGTGSNPDISSAGLLTSLTKTSLAGSNNAQAAQTGLLNSSAQNMGTSGQANTDYLNAVKNLEDTQNRIAQQKQSLESSGASSDIARGLELANQNQWTTQLAAAQNAVNQTQQTIQNQLQGTQTQQQGYNEAGGLAQTGQGMVQSGLSTAAGYAQPQQVPYGTPLVNPQTGGVLGGGGTTSGGVDPSSPFYATMQEYAQLMASNQGSAVPGSITQNPVLNAQLMQMAKTINPNFNYNVAAGAGGAQTQTAGSQYTQIQNYQSSQKQAKNLTSQFEDLLQSSGVNPSEFQKANGVLQTIASNTSDSRYKMLDNYVKEISAAYAGILAGGGDVTNQVRDSATGMLDGLASGQSLTQVLNQIDQAASAKISGTPTPGGLGGNSNAGNFTEGQTSQDGSLVYHTNGGWTANKK